MDISTVAGFIIGVAVLLYAVAGGEGGLRPFWDVASVYITIVGAIAAVTIATPLSQLKQVPRLLAVAFKQKREDPLRIIDNMMELAEKARREGLLALEDKAAEARDPFLKRGIQLIVDGTDPETVRDILETDLANIEERHKSGRSMLDAMTNWAPAFGMIGTLIGLVQMLRTLDQPSTIGPAMSVALITTLYGAVIANLMTGPLSNKLAAKSAEEIKLKEMVLEGILSVQSGENPRIVEEKLLGFLSPKDRLRAGQRSKDKKSGAGQQEMAGETGVGASR